MRASISTPTEEGAEEEAHPDDPQQATVAELPFSKRISFTTDDVDGRGGRGCEGLYRFFGASKLAWRLGSWGSSGMGAGWVL